MSALASWQRVKSFSKRDILWNMEVILIQFAAFLTPFLSIRGHKAVVTPFRTKAIRFSLEGWSSQGVSRICQSYNRASVARRMHANIQSWVQGAIGRFSKSMFAIFGGRPSAKSFSIYRINSIESAIEPFIGFCINRANNLANHPLTHTRWLRNSIMCEKNKPEISFR